MRIIPILHRIIMLQIEYFFLLLCYLMFNIGRVFIYIPIHLIDFLSFSSSSRLLSPSVSYVLYLALSTVRLFSAPSLRAFIRHCFHVNFLSAFLHHFHLFPQIKWLCLGTQFFFFFYEYDSSDDVDDFLTPINCRICLLFSMVFMCCRNIVMYDGDGIKWEFSWNLCRNSCIFTAQNADNFKSIVKSVKRKEKKIGAQTRLINRFEHD